MLESTKESCEITMFIRFLQLENIWPCELHIGEKPTPCTTEKVWKLKNEFVEKLNA